MREDHDWKGFCELIRASDEITAGKPRSAAALGMMFKVLENYSLEDISRAVSAHVRACKFAVMPADIVRQIDGSPEEKAAVAWREFLRALDRYGYYDSVQFPDPAFHYAIIQLGGWERIGLDWHSLTPRETEFRGKEFRQLYETGMRVASWTSEPGKTRVPRYLRGFYENDNSGKGYVQHIPAIINVMNGEKTRQQALQEPHSDGSNVIGLFQLFDGLRVEEES